MDFGFGRKDDVGKRKEEEEEGEEQRRHHHRRRHQQHRKEEKGQHQEEEEEEDVAEEGDEGLDPRALARVREQRRRRRRHQQRCDEDTEDQSDEPQQPDVGGDGSGVVVRVHCGESIQDALDNASPGCTIFLEAGTYYESIKSRVDGTKDQPITIKGPKRGPSAIIKGDDRSGSCVEINHDYHILHDFTIDGMIREPREREEVKECFRSKCLAIRGERPHRTLTRANGEHYISAVDGCVVKNMKIYNCGGEGIRLRYFVTNTSIFHNRIMSTGCFDFKFEGDQGKKNGEGIYVGTSSTQWDQNVSGEPDICRFTRIYENYIDTQGNECVDVKEGTTNTVIETNYCTGQLDEDSAGIDSRADDTIIRFNKVVGCKGAGVRLGGHKVHDYQYGINCQVYGNILEDNEFAGIKVMTEPHQIFQNVISGRRHKYKPFRGKFADNFNGNSECPFDIGPPKQDIETAKWYQKCKP